MIPQRVHLIGIGGAGLSAIARVLLERGHSVRGSDMADSPVTASLSEAGATVFIGHAAGQLGDAELVIRSSAVPDDNPEVQAALAAGVPVVKRNDFLAGLMRGQATVAVAGSHGKTTTSALTAFLLYRTDQDPSFIVGGQLADLGVNARNGNGSAFVIEADEYDHMFLGLEPTVAVVTNIEHDHPDFYPTYADIQTAFNQFARNVPDDGRLIACFDDPGARALAAHAGVPAHTYGLERQAMWRAEHLRANAAGGTDFLVTREGQTLGLARIRLPGDHNVRNALAAIIACDYLGLPLSDLLPALRDFTGTGRRFEVKGEVNDITVIDDYAHHPTEIRATLSAARVRYGRRRPIWALFQPHTFSRTRALMLDFATSFSDADHVLVTDIFRSREHDDGSVSAGDIVRLMSGHPDAEYVGTIENAIDVLSDRLQAGDLLITLGAGDSYKVAEGVLERLQS